MATKTVFGYTFFYKSEKAKTGSWETTNGNDSKHEHIFSIFWITNEKYKLSGRVLSIILGPYMFMLAIKR